MKSGATSVDQYLSELPESQKKALGKIRFLIKHHAPGAEEKMQYGLPMYALRGPLFVLAAKGEYMTIVVAERELVDKYLDELDEKGLLYVGKGSIRFRDVADIKLEVLEDLLIEAYLKRKADMDV